MFCVRVMLKTEGTAHIHEAVQTAHRRERSHRVIQGGRDAFAHLEEIKMQNSSHPKRMKGGNRPG